MIAIVVQNYNDSMNMTLLDFKINVNHLNRTSQKKRDRKRVEKIKHSSKHEMTLSEINHYLQFNQIEKNFARKLLIQIDQMDQQFNHLENKLTQIIQYL